jgi:mono/diheme cytochrome c family protein
VKHAALVIVGCAFVTALVSAQGQKTIWDGVYTDEQARRGAEVYAGKCAACHGDGLGGVESAPPLTGPTFYATWEGETLNALFERMRTSMPQDAPGTLSRAQNADVLAYMLKVGNYPASSTELDGQAASMSAVKVLTYKP